MVEINFIFPPLVDMVGYLIYSIFILVICGLAAWYVDDWLVTWKKRIRSVGSKFIIKHH